MTGVDSTHCALDDDWCHLGTYLRSNLKITRNLHLRFLFYGCLETGTGIRVMPSSLERICKDCSPQATRKRMQILLGIVPKRSGQWVMKYEEGFDASHFGCGGNLHDKNTSRGNSCVQSTVMFIIFGEFVGPRLFLEESLKKSIWVSVWTPHRAVTTMVQIIIGQFPGAR